MAKERRNLLLISLISISLVLFSCSKSTLDKNTEKAQEELETENSQFLEEKIDKTMKAFRELNNTSQVDLDIFIEYIDENIDKVGKENGDEMVFALEEKLLGRIQNYEKNLKVKDQSGELLEITEEGKFLSKDDLLNLENKDLKDYIEELVKKGYSILKREGRLNLLVDYNKLLNYEEFLSYESSEYLSLEFSRIENPMILDGKTVMDYNKIFNRLSQEEDYLIKSPTSPRYEKVLYNYRNDLIVFLKGSRAEGIANQDTGKIKDEILQAYRKSSKDRENVSSFILRKHLSEIEENNLTINYDIESRVLSLVNEALNIIEEKSLNGQA